MQRLTGAPAAMLVLVVASSGGALEPESRSCTMIGCRDGLRVVVENPPDGPYTVALILPDGTRRSARCELASGCGGGLFFEDVSAGQVIVEITGRAGTGSRAVHPEYDESLPNGPGCPPVCVNARVRVRYQP